VRVLLNSMQSVSGPDSRSVELDSRSLGPGGQSLVPVSRPLGWTVGLCDRMLGFWNQMVCLCSRTFDLRGQSVDLWDWTVGLWGQMVSLRCRTVDLWCRTEDLQCWTIGLFDQLVDLGPDRQSL